MDLDLYIRKTFVNYQFPISQISVESIENTMRYLNSLDVNNSDLSKEIVGARGWVATQNKEVLESILAQTFMKTQYGKNCFLDFETPSNTSVIKVRTKYCRTSLKNTQEDWLLRELLINKFEDSGLRFNEEKNEFFGFEEMKKKNSQDYSQFMAYIHQTHIKSLYRLNFLSN